MQLSSFKVMKATHYLGLATAGHPVDKHDHVQIPLHVDVCAAHRVPLEVSSPDDSCAQQSGR